MNNVVLIGRITKDLEIRKTMSGYSTTSFTIACNRIGSQEGQQQADFISCVAWNKTAENLGLYCGKGSLIAIKGKIQTRNYENQQGQKVYVTEVLCEQIEFLESKNSRQNNPQNSYSNNQYNNQNNNSYNDNDYGYGNAGIDLQPDDLPF